MEFFEHIPISEQRLISSMVIGVILVILSAVCAGILSFFVVREIQGVKQKKEIEKQRADKIRQKAGTDTKAAAIAARMERKSERRQQREKKQSRARFFGYAFLITLAIAVIVIEICGVIIPTWTDYAMKDYVIYTGKIEVTAYTSGRRYITLEDGTVVFGVGDFHSEDTHGTVVYAKRSKRLLGGENLFVN